MQISGYLPPLKNPVGTCQWHHFYSFKGEQHGRIIMNGELGYMKEHGWMGEQADG
jgi:hypothetical protein